MGSRTLGRRQFVQGVGTLGMLAAAGGEIVRADAGATSMRWPKLVGSPVLDSLHPVIERSRDVHTHLERLHEVAG